MNTLSKHLFAVLMGAVIFSSCSRPVAYFQPSQREQFTSPKTETVATATPVEATQPTADVTPAPQPAETPTGQVAQVKAAVSQVEAYVRNDSKLASNKKLAKRMTRVNELLVTAGQNKSLAATTTTPAKKMTMMERVVLKKMDKQIRKHVAPDEAKALSSLTVAGIVLVLGGIIIAAIFSGLIGGLLALVGIVLILLEVLGGA